MVAVKVPWLGLQPAEGYAQLIDSLLALDSAVERVFDRVDRRITEEREALRGLEARIEVASARAKRVAGSSAATVVFSAARYPRPEHVPFKTIEFGDDAAAAAAACELPAEAPTESAMAMAARRDAMRGASVAEGEWLDDYRRAISLRPELAANHRNADNAPEGLGSAARLESASNMLLFNTKQNVYAAYKPIDNLSGDDALRLH
eukprot:2294291-Prymnesium_polylepis.1